MSVPLPAAPARPAPAPDVLRELRWWRTGAALLVTAVVLGVLQALLWAAVAPSEPFKVDKTGGYSTLPTGSSQLFVGVALFALLGVIAGVVLALVAWSRRSLRGAGMVVLLGLAAGVGALTAYLLARILAPGVDPGAVGASATESIVGAPAVVGSAMVLLAETSVAALVYTVLVMAHPAPDLRGGNRSEPS